MYEGFFRFQTRPFPAAPTVANYYPAQCTETARQNLIRAIERSEGPGLIIGPTGVGKTLLLQVLGDYFSQAVRVVLLSGTRIASRKSLLQSILFELGLRYRGLDEGELRLALIDALRRNENLPNGILLLIDESQTLSMRLLDEMRLITNLVHDGHPKVRLVLSGTPQLEERFTNPKLESFNQRIAARCYLQAFSREETYEYVRAEVSWAGGDPDALFPEDSVRAIFQATDGIPRLINQVCDHALVLAHTQGHRQVTALQIQEAWADIQQLPPPWQPAVGNRPSAGSTVIEFGELPAQDDDIEIRETIDEVFDEPVVTVEHDPVVAQNDCPTEREEPELTEFADFTTESQFIHQQFAEANSEWVSFGEYAPIEELPPPRVELDPFADAFEEDVVVIDRHAARNLDGLRGRPRVSCAESRDMAACLSMIECIENSGEPNQVGNLPEYFVQDTPSTEAFQFSTLQDLPAIDLVSEFVDTLATISASTDEQVELDFEEEIDCVPLPWTRGTLEDDRDIIVVEEDTPRLGLGSTSEVTAEGRRTEFRDLFAQLRRVST